MKRPIIDIIYYTQSVVHSESHSAHYCGKDR